MYHNSYTCQRSCTRMYKPTTTAKRLTIPRAWRLLRSSPNSATHSLNAIAIIRVFIYILIVVSTQFQLSTDHSFITPSSFQNSISSRLLHYVHVPHSSICPPLNQINCFLLIDHSMATDGLQCFYPCK